MLLSSSPFTARDWYTVDQAARRVSSGRLTYQYGGGYLHNGDGISITRFEDAKTGANYAYGFDGQYKNGAWDSQPVTFGAVNATDEYVEVAVHTGQTDKIDRLYRSAPILEITYQRNDADWTEEFVYAPGAEDEIAFFMHGMDDVIGLRGGKALWDKVEAEYGHNHGDHFLAVNGSSVAQCTVHGHFIYGFINRVSGHGVGFVYPTWITTYEWKVWWTEVNKIEIEYAPHGKLGRRWIFAVTQGKDEILAVGQRLAQYQTWSE